MSKVKAGLDRACPVCEEPSEAVRFGEKNGFGFWRCGRCACRFAGRLPSRAELNAYYETYYPSAGVTLPEFLRVRLAEIVAGFRPYRRTGKLLDVGFGAGLLLSAAHQAGWECWGTELSAQMVEAGRAQGWNVSFGDLPELELPEGEFDVVCLVEVLEHLGEPLTYLRRCRSLLRPGGLLYATTPNGSGLNSRLLGTEWSIYSPPEHLQLFTPRTAAVALRKTGFDQWSIRTEGLNPSELRKRMSRSSGGCEVARNEAGFALNERLSSGRGPRLAKRVANEVLSRTRAGDTLKLFARAAG